MQKISFLNTVGLITHAHAQEAELFQCERRARILGALEPSTIPSSPKHTQPISEELVPMIAPGHSLPPVITTPEELCLAHEYPHKARFLHHLGLQPQHSLHRQQGKIDASLCFNQEWKLPCMVRECRGRCFIYPLVND